MKIIIFYLVLLIGILANTKTTGWKIEAVPRDIRHMNLKILNQQSKDRKYSNDRNQSKDRTPAQDNNFAKDKNYNAAKSCITLFDIIGLSGKTIEDMIQFGQLRGLIIRNMEQGNLDYSMQMHVNGKACTICFQMEEDTGVIEKIYIRPENSMVSEWIKRCNESFGACVDIEKLTSGEEGAKQEIKYMTWLNDNHSISIIQMNHAMYIYITDTD